MRNLLTTRNCTWILCAILSAVAPCAASEPSIPTTSITLINSSTMNIAVSTIDDSVEIPLLVWGTSYLNLDSARVVMLDDSNRLTQPKVHVARSPRSDHMDLFVITVPIHRTRLIEGFVDISVTPADGVNVPVPLRRAFSIRRAAPAELGLILWSALALSLIITACVCRKLHKIFGKLPLAEKMGQPNWDYSRSWASNITAMGAILALFLAVIASAVQPEIPYKVAFGMLNAIYLAMVAIAPTVYNLFSSTEKIPGQEMLPMSMGTVMSYLISSAITMWGVFGQIFTLLDLIRYFALSGLLERYVAICFQTLLILVAAGVGVYSIRTIVLNVKIQNPVDNVEGASTGFGPTEIKSRSLPWVPL